MGKGAQIAIGIVTVCAGLFWLLTAQSGGEGTFAYYQSVADFQRAASTGEPAAAFSDQAARVHGFVVAGSIRKDLSAGHVDFAIRDENGAALPVRLIGIDVPDLFQDDAEVVVEGHAEGQRFVARKIFAKSPSKYEATSDPEA
jgi:cytochrome c-type biogenesis protein CcmE